MRWTWRQRSVRWQYRCGWAEWTLAGLSNRRLSSSPFRRADDRRQRAAPSPVSHPLSPAHFPRLMGVVARDDRSASSFDQLPCPCTRRRPGGAAGGAGCQRLLPSPALPGRPPVTTPLSTWRSFFSHHHLHRSLASLSYTPFLSTPLLLRCPSFQLPSLPSACHPLTAV